MNHGLTYDVEISEILTTLWKSDENACRPGVDYKLNLQNYVTGTEHVVDRAKEKLFSYFNEQLIFSKPTYAAFFRLLDNYNADIAAEEVETPEEVDEVNNFLTAILNTPVMKEAHKFLVAKKKSSSDKAMFKNQLFTIWFKLYRRERGNRNENSCGFEHVFVGEKKGEKIMGFHNWIQFYFQEKLGKVDYYGYFRRGTTYKTDQNPRLVTLQFTWNGTAKPIGSTFFGTSPEFEVAMYTICFLCGHKEVNAKVDSYPVEIVIYPLGHQGIGTAFPKSLSG